MKEEHVFPPMCLPWPPDHCCANGTSPTECLHLCLYIIGSGLRTVRHRNAMFFVRRIELICHQVGTRSGTSSH